MVTHPCGYHAQLCLTVLLLYIVLVILSLSQQHCNFDPASTINQSQRLHLWATKASVVLNLAFKPSYCITIIVTSISFTVFVAAEL